MSAANTYQGPFLDSVQGLISPQILDKISQFLGESPSKVIKGVGAAIPAVLAEIVQKGSSRQGADQILSYINSDAYQQPITGPEVEKQLREVTADPSIAKEGGALDNLLGGQLNFIAQTISSVSGMTSAATTSLLAAVSGIAMGMLGSKFAGPGVKSSELQHYLITQKSSVFSALPQSLKSIVDFSGVGARVQDLSQRKNWGWVAGLIAILAIGGMWLSRMGNTQRIDIDKSDSAILMPGAIAIPMHGSPEALEAYLATGSIAELPKRFRFDDLNFEFATATLIPGSHAIVDNIAQVLVNHPLAKVQLEGHTDIIGTTDENMKLSIDRAEAIRAILVDKGVRTDRIEVSGRGDTQPIAANDSEANRQLNRRIELIVIQK